MLFRRTEKNPDDFWLEYEGKIGEKVLARALGQYLSGWEEFDKKGWTAIWGLIIATTGGFRFHHFPQASWLDALSRFTSQETPKEKTFFIPKETIISARLIKETGWLKKIFKSTPPRLSIHYRDGTENERQLLLEVDFKPEDLVEKLSAFAENTQETAQE
jgi:hypothetical protein